jgi:hypothetical protein
MSNNYIKTLDPIQGLVDYVLDIKPYHTKIAEVLIEYVYNDNVVTLIDETLVLSWGPSTVPIVSVGGSPANAVEIEGDWTNGIIAGDVVSIDGISYTVLLVTDTSPTTTIELSDTPSLGSPYGILVLATDVVSYFTFNVEEINADENYIVVQGPATASVFSGQEIQISGSTSNNGVVTVTGSPTFNGLSTKIPVVGPLTTETVGGTPPTITPYRYFVI